MTTDSTKYFCRRGATSARLNLVDASLSVEYRYDGEHGKYYFGARYFDPFFGMWMSPDPAAVFFREVYAPLKWRDFIEKDILQRSNVEAVLLKQSFRASAQFANPYSYGGDPLNYVDPNGEAVQILVGAIIGAVVGTVNGVIQCTSAGGGSCTKSIGVGFVGGAAVGAGAAATGGLAAGGTTAVLGTGTAATVTSAVVGGAVGGLLYGLSDNYALWVDKTVAEWGDRMGMLDRATKAIGYSGDYSVEINGITGEFGKSEYNITKNKVILNADDFSKMGEDGQLIRDASENSVFDSEKFVYATKHETFHYKLTNEYMYRTGTTRDAINSMSKEEFYRTIAHPQEMIAKDINSYRYKDVWRKDINSYINSSLEKEIEGFRKFETIYGY